MLSGFLFLFWVGPLDREGFAATTSTQKARHFWHPRPFLDTPLPTKPPPQWHPFFDTPSPFFNNPHPGHPLCARTHTDTPFVPPPPFAPHPPAPPFFDVSNTISPLCTATILVVNAVVSRWWRHFSSNFYWRPSWMVVPAGSKQN